MQSGLIYLRAWRAGKGEKFSHAGAGPIKIRSAFVEERFTALMAGAETAGYTGGNFLFLRATRGNAMDAIYCVPLTVATFFQPSSRRNRSSRGETPTNPVHTVLPDTFSGIRYR